MEAYILDILYWIFFGEIKLMYNGELDGFYTV